MKITSPSFANNQNIPKEFTCDGQDINPALNLTDVPANSQSLALIVDDPDAPRGTWTHWIVWNISPATKSIAKNSKPENAIEGVTSVGRPGYGGPCPPSGTHRYFFKIYALDIILDLPATADINQLTTAMESHVIDRAELIGLYSKM